ncbi:hypothetical protein EG359_18470 [Chryseobacterium joostei]|uniref:YD repeat-containing protein n=1 Tax=Chryseobacterium joostei TaxID=112234 RepID=A0A1N7IZF7_9FLAO|nr:hypothetical protein EG359_18470 [Chryseobacterium joostei]SIS42361.1 hypothetical protein SAMN05421768_10764 [Chryseobacterium joostei]
MKAILLFFIFSSSFFYSQIIKDTVLGKPKSVKEFVIFLNESGPFNFMKGDDEYGHATIMKPKNLRLSMKRSWFETDFCRYINNETYYDKNRNIIKETWYYKSGEIVEDYVYTYDDLNRLMLEKSKNKYSEKTSRYFYNGKNKNVKFKEHYSKWKDEPVKRYFNNIENIKPLFITKYDTLSNTDSIFAITNNIWKGVGDGSYTRSNDTIYHKKLNCVKFYDNKYRIVEEKFFNYEDDLKNKKIYLNGHLKYEYDSYGNIIKKTNVDDGKFYSYMMSDSGKIIKEEKKDSFGKTSYTVYNYTKDQKLERETSYYNDNVSLDIRFEYKDNYITKVFYLDKFGQQNKIEPTVITFKYVFDKKNNWTEIIKNVDGKDLYKWIRKIEYY